MPQAAVIGSPVAHSLSPVLHRAAYQALGVPDWRYIAVDVTAGELAAFLAQVRSPHWAGLSVTMPHKKAIVAGARSVCEQTARLGVANTVIAEADGYRVANTDVAGLAAALRRADPHLSDPKDHRTPSVVTGDPEHVPGRSDTTPLVGSASADCGASDGGALIVGSGATARSAIAAAATLGVPYLGLTARSEAALVSLQRLAGQYGLVAHAMPWSAGETTGMGAAGGSAAMTSTIRQELAVGDGAPGGTRGHQGNGSLSEPGADSSGVLAAETEIGRAHV